MSEVFGSLTATDDEITQLDVAIVGAGFSGLYALHRLRALGLRLRVFDEAGGVGGSWWWNRYPGARVDFLGGPLYCYTFSEDIVQAWEWEETHPDQGAVVGYLNYVADTLDLRRDIRLSTRVQRAVFDEGQGRWHLTTSDGKRYSAQFLVGALGILSKPFTPHIEGLADFAGEMYHTGLWPQDGSVDFSGKRVAVIGTGSSGVQSIPEIAKTAAHVTVFQRTPQYVIPARTTRLDPDLVSGFRASWPETRQQMIDSYFGAPRSVGWGATRSGAAATAEERREVFEEHWQKGGGGILLSSFNDILVDPETNEALAEFVRSKIKETVSDPGIAEKLLPAFHIGTKRLILGNGYYETFNQPHVTLVDLRAEPIGTITATGVRTAAGEYDVDMIVLATGYDAITGAHIGLNPVGRGGQELKSVWSHGVGTYLGMTISGFPNLFMMQGPGSPSALYNMPLGAERQGDWIAECIAHLRESGADTIEPTLDAQEAWTEDVRQIADHTLYSTAESWYSGANIPGKPRQFLVHLDAIKYYDALDQAAQNGYEEFLVESSVHVQR
jgi:cation diffusion facilitator CzcD-associated flavoprotein CzcO